jgi:hypothetical protein
MQGGLMIKHLIPCRMLCIEQKIRQDPLSYLGFIFKKISQTSEIAA